MSSYGAEKKKIFQLIYFFLSFILFPNILKMSLTISKSWFVLIVCLVKNPKLLSTFFLFVFGVLSYSNFTLTFHEVWNKVLIRCWVCSSCVHIVTKLWLLLLPSSQVCQRRPASGSTTSGGCVSSGWVLWRAGGPTTPAKASRRPPAGSRSTFTELYSYWMKSCTLCL